MTLTLVTGNPHKAQKTSELLGRKLEHKSVHLDELQTTNLTELVEHKVRQAYEAVGSPVLVDDFGFGFNALNGLPGPFTKFFIEQPDGDEKMCRMIDSFEDRSAFVTCVIGFYDGTTLKVFSKTLPGTTAPHPKGSNGIATDRIFIPQGYNVTRAELGDSDYDEVYEMVRPFDELREFLQEYESSNE